MDERPLFLKHPLAAREPVFSKILLLPLEERIDFEELAAWFEYEQGLPYWSAEQYAWEINQDWERRCGCGKWARDKRRWRWDSVSGGDIPTDDAIDFELQ